MTEISSAKMRALAQRLREGRYSGSISVCSQQLLSAADQIDAKDSRIKALEAAARKLLDEIGTPWIPQQADLMNALERALAATDGGSLRHDDLKDMTERTKKKFAQALQDLGNVPHPAPGGRGAGPC